MLKSGALPVWQPKTCHSMKGLELIKHSWFITINEALLTSCTKPLTLCVLLDSGTSLTSNVTERLLHSSHVFFECLLCVNDSAGASISRDGDGQQHPPFDLQSCAWRVLTSQIRTRGRFFSIISQLQHSNTAPHPLPHPSVPSPHPYQPPPFSLSLSNHP